MMHGHEKSDPAIVAVKPANKAANPAVEQSAAEPATVEPVEPRAGTKGNADQQSTCRAQSGVSVSQALDRIRKVAKERKSSAIETFEWYGCDAVRRGRPYDLVSRVADSAPLRGSSGVAGGRHDGLSG